MKKVLNLKRLLKNSGEKLTSLYGCSGFGLPKGEKVLERKSISPNNSIPSASGGWIGERIKTNLRVIKVVYDYMNGSIDVFEEGHNMEKYYNVVIDESGEHTTANVVEVESEEIAAQHCREDEVTYDNFYIVAESADDAHGNLWGEKVGRRVLKKR